MRYNKSQRNPETFPSSNQIYLFNIFLLEIPCNVYILLIRKVPKGLFEE